MTRLGTLAAMLVRKNALVVRALGFTVVAFTAYPRTLDEPPLGGVNIDGGGPFSP